MISGCAERETSAVQRCCCVKVKRQHVQCNHVFQFFLPSTALLDSPALTELISMNSFLMQGPGGRLVHSDGGGRGGEVGVNICRL